MIPYKEKMHLIEDYLEEDNIDPRWYSMIAEYKILIEAISSKKEDEMDTRDFKNHVCAVDFDGTLCELAWPAIGAPRTDIINYVKNLRAQGWYLILWTNREGDKLERALEWCSKQGLEFDAINENIKERRDYYGNDIRKVGANLFIDDLAVNPDNLVGCPVCRGREKYLIPLGDNYCSKCGRKLR